MFYSPSQFPQKPYHTPKVSQERDRHELRIREVIGTPYHNALPPWPWGPAEPRAVFQNRSATMALGDQHNQGEALKNRSGVR